MYNKPFSVGEIVFVELNKFNGNYPYVGPAKIIGSHKYHKYTYCIKILRKRRYKYSAESDFVRYLEIAGVNNIAIQNEIAIIDECEIIDSRTLWRAK